MGAMRSRLRLGSALILLSFVVCHLSGHSLLLVSQATAEPVLAALMKPWRSNFGTALLVGAFLVHYANALWALYDRRTLRMTRWEWAQLGLGLCIPLLLILHVASTRIAEATAGVDTSYAYVLTRQWVVAPWEAVLQVTAVTNLWVDGCIGLDVLL